MARKAATFPYTKTTISGGKGSDLEIVSGQLQAADYRFQGNYWMEDMDKKLHKDW